VVLLDPYPPLRPSRPRFAQNQKLLEELSWLGPYVQVR
jgi:hypothetical protein